MSDAPLPPERDAVMRVDIVRTLPSFSLAVRFDLAREVLVLFGPSGSGKSLTLQAIAGVDRPNGGRIAIAELGGAERPLFDAAAGVDVKPQDRRIGYVPQSLALFPHLSVAENVTYGLRRLPAEARADEARRLLALMRLSGLAERLPGRLSGGQRQRVALARALAVTPRVLLLDEPFTALDGPTRRLLGHEVRRLHEERGVPILLVTHDTDEAFALADRVAVLDEGRLLQIGPRRDVFAKPASRRVAELVGIENVLPAVVRGRRGAEAVVAWGDRSLIVAGVPAEAWAEVGARVDVAVSASQITVLRTEAEAAPEGRSNVITVRSTRTEMGRDTIRMELVPASGPVSAPLHLELPAYAYYRLGLETRETFAVQLKPEWLHLMPAA
jgi:molybdate transport system ATP-binding protein